MSHSQTRTCVHLWPACNVTSDTLWLKLDVTWRNRHGIYVKFRAEFEVHASARAKLAPHVARCCFCYDIMTGVVCKLAPNTQVTNCDRISHAVLPSQPCCACRLMVRSCRSVSLTAKIAYWHICPNMGTAAVMLNWKKIVLPYISAWCINFVLCLHKCQTEKGHLFDYVVKFVSSVQLFVRSFVRSSLWSITCTIFACSWLEVLVGQCTRQGELTWSGTTNAELQRHEGKQMLTSPCILQSGLSGWQRILELSSTPCQILMSC